MPTLGHLEIAVLEHLWQVADASAKETHAALGMARGISLNTVQSTLERLYRKELLTRAKASHAYRYSPRMAREQLMARLINDVVGRFGGDMASALAAFVGTADRLDDEALQALETELRTRRKRNDPS
ncbi:MAG: BlaI/MecI/CopY family transcriptional regulator [Wenzhouxiangellaceae bacterium]|nr:BlaI/MecI/CopY family transcriptional regulator [Wenzhouxiangellaceae bacterium]